jgi:hypothetical protein
VFSLLFDSSANFDLHCDSSSRAEPRQQTALRLNIRPLLRLQPLKVSIMGDDERRAKRSRFDQTELEPRRQSRFDRRSRSPSSRQSEPARARSPLSREPRSPGAESQKKPSTAQDPALAAGKIALPCPAIVSNLI